MGILAIYRHNTLTKVTSFNNLFLTVAKIERFRFCMLCTAMVKKLGHMLRDPFSYLSLAAGANSRNLRPIFSPSLYNLTKPELRVQLAAGP